MLRIAIIIGNTRPGGNGEAVAKKLNADVGVGEAEKQAASAGEHGPRRHGKRGRGDFSNG